MKVKIAKNVILDGKVLKKDDVHDLPDRHGDLLIKGGHAFEHREPTPAAARQKKADEGGTSKTKSEPSQTGPTGQTESDKKPAAPEGDKK